jgi:hypothetical protein
MAKMVLAAMVMVIGDGAGGHIQDSGKTVCCKNNVANGSPRKSPRKSISARDATAVSGMKHQINGVCSALSACTRARELPQLLLQACDLFCIQAVNELLNLEHKLIRLLHKVC